MNRKQINPSKGWPLFRLPTSLRVTLWLGIHISPHRNLPKPGISASEPSKITRLRIAQTIKTKNQTSTKNLKQMDPATAATMAFRCV